MSSEAPIAAKSSPGASGLPPGPQGRFLVGNIFQLTRDLMGFLTRCAQQYGDVVFFRFFRTPVCLVNHPDLIESVLVANDRNFTKSRDYRAMRRVLDDGLLTSEGELWKRQRRLMQPAFHRERITSYAAIMTGYADRMLASWQDGEERDVHEDMMRLTIEIVAKALFDVEISRDAQGIGLALGIFVQEFIGMASLAFVLPESIPVPGSGKLRRA
ncbi:MAG TPA: cytochrome P450, partial [Candidatus Dormibacteraeota bacterium]|nr:cytochrome P450 [Candidatus Dormibacteraeota bacterium]